jgi:hypothetical protein
MIQLNTKMRLLFLNFKKPWKRFTKSKKALPQIKGNAKYLKRVSILTLAMPLTAIIV